MAITPTSVTTAAPAAEWLHRAAKAVGKLDDLRRWVLACGQPQTFQGALIKVGTMQTAQRLMVAVPAALCLLLEAFREPSRGRRFGAGKDGTAEHGVGIGELDEWQEAEVLVDQRLQVGGIALGFDVGAGDGGGKAEAHEILSRAVYVDAGRRGRDTADQKGKPQNTREKELLKHACSSPMPHAGHG